MRLNEYLGIRLPLIQAPMAGAQGSEMAIAVSEAGGLGSLPCGMLSQDELRAELVAIRAQTNRPFNVNFFCHQSPIVDEGAIQAWRAALMPYYEALGVSLNSTNGGANRVPFDAIFAEILSEFKPPVVSFHFGLPSEDLMRYVRSWGATIISSATTVDEAVWLVQNGADVVIAQGLEAGGHRGLFLSDDLSTQLGTLPLVSRVLQAVNVPVVAAGGIADAQGVAAMMALGAAGVQVGTAYLLCDEAKTSALHRAALRNAATDTKADHTALTNVFSGRPARGIVNRVMRELGLISSVAPPFPLATAEVAPLRARAEANGSSDFSPLWAGQNTLGCREVPAAELTAQLCALL